jgi:outer membrane protein assembly factor BamD (BamD/ComL family)
MAAKKISRKELLKPTDEFLSVTARTIQFVKEHAQVFSNIGLGILIVILIGMAFYAYKMYADKKGQELYNEAYNAFMQYEQAAPDQKAEALKKTEELFQKMRDEQKIAKASKLVAPELAYLKYQERKYDEAIVLYQDYQKKIPTDSPYYALASLAIAACYEEKGEFANACHTLEQAMSGSKEAFKEQIMVSLARNYRLSNQKDKAKEILKEFVEKYPNSSYSAMAKVQLSQLP